MELSGVNDTALRYHARVTTANFIEKFDVTEANARKARRNQGYNLTCRQIDNFSYSLLLPPRRAS
jgi:hypothetical protein